MPHFGLMDESKMSEEDAALMRAKLHIRGGRRRMRQEKYAAGIAALYDAFGSGMKWYLLTHQNDDRISVTDTDVLNYENQMFDIISKAGVFREPSDFKNIFEVVDEALSGNPVKEDCVLAQRKIEQLLTRLGVLPFDEDSLPPEDSSTY